MSTCRLRDTVANLTAATIELHSTTNMSVSNADRLAITEAKLTVTSQGYVVANFLFSHQDWQCSLAQHVWPAAYI